MTITDPKTNQTYNFIDRDQIPYLAAHVNNFTTQ